MGNSRISRVNIELELQVFLGKFIKYDAEQSGIFSFDREHGHFN